MPTDRSGDAPHTSVAKIPQYIRDALERRPAARQHFGRLAPSHRRAYIGWMDSAKLQATRMRRLQQAVGLLAAGQKLGLK
jgi:uncharacterized protein YdeI (YjbR/CyaY-like superfamily)